MNLVVKSVDPQGRIVLPAEWRKRHGVREVLVVDEGDRLVILPRRSSLAKYFDAVEVDVKSFEDYHELRRELHEVYRR